MSEINTWPGWECVRLIGEGSFGKVYEIRRVEFGREYNAALKVITIPQNSSAINAAYDEGMDDESVTSYFHSIVADITAEFALMSELKGHSNIVSYEDHMVIEHKDSIGWDIMIRMELLTPLQTYYRNHPMNEQDVIRLGIGICRALELCQQQNVIHRDIKPENIFVSRFGDFKLGDFGIARTVEKTISNLSKKGTYNYMAPEVYRGEAYGVSADIYSLAVVLYRYLNGNRLPFLPQGAIRYNDIEHALQCRIVGNPIPEPVYGSKKLKETVLRALEYDPTKRYLSASEFRMALENCIQDAASGTFATASDSHYDVVTSSSGVPPILSHAKSLSELSDVDKTVSIFNSIRETASHEAITESPFPEWKTEDTAVEEFSSVSAAQNIEISATSENDRTVSIYSETGGTVKSATEENLPVDVQSGQTVSVFGDDEMTVISVSAEQESSLPGHDLPERTGKTDEIEATVPDRDDTSTVPRHRKKFIFVLVAGIIVVVGLFVIVGSLFFMGGNRANNTGNSADSENNTVTWSLENGVLTIRGSGKMDDYSNENGKRPPWYENRKSISSIVIENGVVSVGDYAFFSCTDVTEVLVANSVTTIGQGAFKNCRSIKNMSIPYSVTTIESWAFKQCTSLVDVAIPDSVTYIGTEAFASCNSELTIICYPESYAKQYAEQNKINVFVAN